MFSEIKCRLVKGKDERKITRPDYDSVKPPTSPGQERAATSLPACNAVQRQGTNGAEQERRSQGDGKEAGVTGRAGTDPPANNNHERIQNTGEIHQEARGTGVKEEELPTRTVSINGLTVLALLDT